MNNQTLGQWMMMQLFDPRTGQYLGPTPQVDVKTMGRGVPPQISGGLRMPLGAGSVGVEGQYQSQQGVSPDWGVMLNYKRPF